MNTSDLFSQVKTLKERIEEEKGKDSFSVAGQKLIYAGMLPTVYSLFKWFYNCGLLWEVHDTYSRAE